MAVGGSFLPRIGEAMDLAVALAPDSTLLQRRIALASFGLGVVTLGMSPNFGGYLRLVRGLDRVLDRADQMADVARAVASGSDHAATALAKAARTPRGTIATRIRDFLADESGALHIPGKQAPEGTRVRPSDLGQRQGREFRTDQLETYEFDANQPKHVRGWLENERRRIHGSGGGPDVPRTPPGYVQGHGRTTPAREGFDYSTSRLQGEDLNKLEERVRRRAGRP